MNNNIEKKESVKVEFSKAVYINIIVNVIILPGIFLYLFFSDDQASLVASVILFWLLIIPFLAGICSLISFLINRFSKNKLEKNVSFGNMFALIGNSSNGLALLFLLFYITSVTGLLDWFMGT